MISTFQGWRFQRWRQASLWTTKKIRRQRIRGILEEDQSQTQEELAESLGIIQQAVSVQLRTMEMIQKQRNWVPYELKPRDGERRFFTCNSWFKDNKEKVFCIGFWLEMRSGYSTTIPRRKNTTLSPVNRCHRSQPNMIRRSCSVSGGTKRVLFTMSCWNLAIHYRRSAIIDSFESCIARKTAGIQAKTW